MYRLNTIAPTPSTIITRGNHLDNPFRCSSSPTNCRALYTYKLGIINRINAPRRPPVKPNTTWMSFLKK